MATKPTTKQQTTVETATITLHQTAPWNPNLTNFYRTRYAQHDGRYFRAQAHDLRDYWWLQEITANGKDIEGGPNDHHYLALCRNLPAVRAAIAQYIAGATRDQVWDTASNAPAAGTGRNHPRHVERRNAWRQ